MEDPACRERVKRYEAGDRTALSAAAVDREPAVLDLDVRVVAIGSAETVATANDRADGATNLRTCVDACAEKLTAGGVVKGRVAVIPFKQTGAASDASYGEAASGMMISALKRQNRVILVERIELDKLLTEKDLTYTDIAENPGRLGQVSGIDYLVVGVVVRSK